MGESAITVRELAKECYDLGTLTHELIDAAHNGWKSQLTSSKEGNLLWAKRLLARYDTAIERYKAQRKGKAPNLRSQAAQLREQKPEEAFTLCTWWGNNAHSIAAHLADSDRYEQLLGMFLRGTDQH